MVFNINNIIICVVVVWAVNQYIRMISEGSRDPEDCNDAENSALHLRNKLMYCDGKAE